MNIMQMICETFTDSPYRPKEYNSEYTALMNTYSENLDTLSQILAPEHKPLFFELEAQRNLIGAMDEDRLFTFGFRVGAMLMVELLRSQTL